MLVFVSGVRSNTPEIAKPAGTRSDGTFGQSFCQSVATMAAVRCPPAEWPQTSMRRSKRCHSEAQARRICSMMSAMVTIGQRS